MICLICHKNIEKEHQFIILDCPCNYSYHSICINKWFKNKPSCPTCRKNWFIPKNCLGAQNTIVNSRPRRNAITPQLAHELSQRLFYESIGINSSMNPQSIQVRLAQHNANNYNNC